MPEEFLGDMRSVIRSYRLCQKSQVKEIKQKRFVTFKALAKIFVTKWNPIMKKNYTFSEWVRYMERSKENEQFYEGIRR